MRGSVPHCTEIPYIERLQIEIEELRRQLADKQQALSNVYELWAGIDGMPQPEDEVGWYLFQLVEKMRDAAKEGMK